MRVMSKRAAQQLAIAGVSLALTIGLFFVVQSKDSIFRWSMASGYTGLALLGTSLVIGPWNVIRGAPNPISTHLRRDIGIWGGVVGLVHTVLGLQVHMRGKFWLYFIFSPEESHRIPLRYDLFGFANYTGLAVAMILLLLLSLSNDSSLIRLGLHRWKALQRWNYAGFLLLVLHGAAYQFIEKRGPGFIVLFAISVLLVCAFQVSGFRAIRKEKRVALPGSLASRD